MGRGEFAKSFSLHRKAGGTMTRKEFAAKRHEEHDKIIAEKEILGIVRDGNLPAEEEE